MTVEEPAVAIARMDGRLIGIEKQLSDIKASMATKEGSANLAQTVSDLRDALATERLERLAGDVDAKSDVKAVATRLQLVEDRQEKRKYDFGIAIAIGAIGIILGIVERTVGTGLFGG
jgi:hypothetical protein